MRTRREMTAALVLFLVFCGLAALSWRVAYGGGPAAPPGFDRCGRNSFGLWEYRNQKDGAIFVLIPPGEFQMGSAAGEGNDDEHPARSVFLGAFLMAKHEVTNRQFRLFAAQAGYRAQGEWEREASPERDAFPVASVTWGDAAAYCAWAGARLPTEAEWEKAARGVDGRRYPWGDEWDPRRCRCSTVQLGMAAASAPVGSFPQGVSPYGCLDMAGNVWEWCSDEYRDDGCGGSGAKVLRGGGWENINTEVFRCAYRSAFPGRFRFADRGFRPARAF